MLLFQNVSKSFHGRPSLLDVSLQLNESRIHVVLGSSGSGKSTLLKILMGVVRPDDGTVSLRGSAPVVRDIGYVIQDGGLFPHLTAYQNAGLVPRLMKWSPERIENRVRELASLVGLERAFLEKYPQQLSGGQRQRVGLMRALMTDPPVLALDEPLGALDPIIRSDLQAELKTIFTDLKKTVLFVTHDIGEAAFLGDTVSLFHEGRLIQHGTFEDLVLNPASDYVTRFINAQRPPEAIFKSLPSQRGGQVGY